MARMDEALAEAGLDGVRMLLQVHDELVFEVPDGREEEAAAVIKQVMGARRRAGDDARRAARRRGRLGRALGRRALTDRRAAPPRPQPRRQTPTWRRWLAAGGSTSSASCFGWRRECPFLFIAGRIYGAAALGRFAYAVLVVEFGAQIAALGLRRGLAQLLADAKKPQACIVADALLVAAIGSAVGMAILFAFPKAMYPTTPVGGLDRMLAITVLAVSWTDIALAALAYHHDVGATVRARSIVEPWTITIAAFALSYVPIMVRRGDGLIIAYVLSMVAALIAALIPLVRCYGIPHGWKPDLGDGLADGVAATCRWPPRTRSNGRRAGSTSPCSARSCRQASSAFIMRRSRSRRLPAKLKTSFEPVLGPAIVRKIAANDRASIAEQVRQVTYWIIAAQLGIALALGIPGTRGDGPGRLGISPAARRCSASCSPPKSSRRPPWSANRR